MTPGLGTPTNPFNDNALAYLDAGWQPMPLWNADQGVPLGERAKDKKNPPKGLTGWDGKPPTRDQVRDWIADGRYFNIATRIPEGVIGIDVDTYHGGDKTFAELKERLGDLPATVMSTSRNDAGDSGYGVNSGIRYFRVPEGVEFVKKLPGIDICQKHHRYGVIAPSIHPKLKQPYKWLWSDDYTEYNENNGIPPISVLPQLPDTWFEELKEKRTTDGWSKTDIDSRRQRLLAKEWLTTGRMCSHMCNVLEKVRTSNGGRHDTMVPAQVAIVRLGESGHKGADDAMAELQNWFETAIGNDRNTDKEWRDALRGAYEIVASSPTPTDEKACSDTYRERADNAVLLFNKNREERNRGRLLVRHQADEADAPSPAEGETVDLVDDSDFPDASEGIAEDDDAYEKNGKLRINVANKNRATEWLRHEVGKGPLSGVFHRGGEVVFTPRVGESGYIEPKNGHDGPAQIRILDAVGLKSAVEVRYEVGKIKDVEVPVTDPGTGMILKDDKGKKVTKAETVWVPEMFPHESAVSAYTSARSLDDTPNLRVLKGVTHTPLVRPDGTILDKPGFDDGTRLLYLPDNGLEILPASASPSEIEVRKAVKLIESIVEQFPFVNDFHRANWYGALFTPIMRAVLPPPYPMFVIDAPAPGSGKSYLSMIIRTIHGGILRAGFPTDEAEVEKSIMAILTDTTAPVVTFDNVRGKVKSAKFEAMLTSGTFAGRVLGVTKSKDAPNDRLWLVTANNAEIDGDLARRTYWITIDPRRPRPFERSGFKLDLRTWVPEHRSEVIWAMLTVIRAWVVAGMPKAEKKRSDDFANWDAGMAGMLKWAGFQAGTFGESDQRHMESNEDYEWELFLNEVFEVLGSKSFKMTELVNHIADTISGDPVDGEWRVNKKMIDPTKLPGDLAEKWSKSGFSKAGFTKSLGKWFKNRAGRYVGDLVVRVSEDPKRGNSYRVVNYRDEEMTA